ncbi:hypothetical protein AVEN_135010-1 [Araneus ventricosus]|uniref:Helitron helicase-like domain-containing protein n=1 Tax=Araneus ventricosus TaxID=182803 RepID=A0A4Y2G9K9_ARAVE|nr:hypothetical protein AVEN_135010-1 [Araneus ventricosus]
MSLQDLYYNLRRREQHSNESFDETLQRRSARNEADRLRRARKRSDQLCQRRANRVRNQIEVNVPEHSCVNMSEVCEFCSALYLKNEVNSSKKYTKCCLDGKVRLPNPLTEAPDLFKELFCSNSQEAKNYRHHIREYNAALAFASMGAEIKTPPLHSNERNKPGYGQLYIFDSSKASNRRMENNQACLHSVMEKLDALLRSINPFAESYMQMHQLMQSNPAANVKMVFMEHTDLDLRRYNAPTSRTEVAAIFVGDDGEPPANRDICIYPVTDSYKNISSLNQCSDPMVYLLLFLNRECGWNSIMEHVEERRSAKRVRVTQLQYYSYRFVVRNAFSILHNSGKLFQQYIVDAYGKTEGSRLNYLRLNQKDLRVELYEGFSDALQTEATNNGSKI